MRTYQASYCPVCGDPMQGRLIRGRGPNQQPCEDCLLRQAEQAKAEQDKPKEDK